MIRPEYAGNPFVEWLDKNRLMPNQAAIMANVDYSVVYAIMRGCVRTLPLTVIDAVDQYGADGDGAKLDKAYQVYRENLRRELLTKPAA